MNNLALLRQERKIKQIDMAKMLKVSQGTLSNWERGVHDIDQENLDFLAEFFNVSVDYILGRSSIPNPYVINIFSTNLKQIRKVKDVTQHELAKYLSVSQQAVAKWETDKATPDPDTLKKMADFFDVSIDYLLGHSSSQHSHERLLPDKDFEYLQKMKASDKPAVKAIAAAVGKLLREAERLSNIDDAEKDEK